MGVGVGLDLGVSSRLVVAIETEASLSQAWLGLGKCAWVGVGGSGDTMDASGRELGTGTIDSKGGVGWG